MFPVGGGTSNDESITPLGSRHCSGYMTHSIVLDRPCLIKMDWGINISQQCYEITLFINNTKLQGIFFFNRNAPTQL